MLEQIENHMVVDAYWKRFEETIDVEEKIVEKGYLNLNTKEFITDADAFSNALWECLFGPEDLQKEFKDMLLEFYYDGSWVREE